MPTEVTWSIGATVVTIDTTTRLVSTPSLVVTAQVVTLVPTTPTTAIAVCPTSRFASSTFTAPKGIGSSTSTLLTSTTGSGVGVAVRVTAALSTNPAGRAESTGDPDATWSVYDALATEAGVGRPVRVRDPRVIVGQLDHQDGRSFVWLISQSAEELEVEPVVAPGRVLVDESGESVDGVLELAPFAVRVLELR